jgi:class 3 adenylate cyclase
MVPMEELTRAVSLPRPRRFSLRFPNRELEAAFRRRFAAEAVSRHRFLISLVVVMWVAFAAFDQVIMSGASLFEIRLLRFGIVLPIVAVNLLLSYAPRRIFERYWQPALAVGFAALAGAMIYYVVKVAEPYRPGGTAGIALVIVGGYTLVMMRFVYALPVALAITAAVALVHAHHDGVSAITTRAVPTSMIWVYLANVIGVFSCRELEMFRRTKFVQAQQIEREQERAEALLGNTLPRSIVERLKHGEQRIVDSFDEVTVLFGDVVGFTRLAGTLSPRELVDLLNDLYSAFDELAERHGLEKIKTVGDAYMVVGGAPLPRADHAEAVAGMALDMLDAVVRLRRDWPDLAIRIGIHTGPAVGGVIGTQKLSYDVWGDTVNIASRLQEHGVPGVIHVSVRTRALLAHRFDFVSRGNIQLKGRGELPTYTLRSRSAAAGSL